ncbi:hypothetical protein D4764_10G0006040 [Takifugu flavidus]|uniref:C2H2-type domain-containing protein n=1 Tax=Takifugu flavidus TaxID=433684 RepID=A0A5C6PIF3_9TELE|nr:hypothetical protein D4764_10G0006040 [Takifugu flavidus]
MPPRSVIRGSGKREEEVAREEMKRKYECDLCERTFSEKWALNNHKKLHNGEKPYKCAWPSCHYSFLNLSAMKDHYRTHTVNDRSGSQGPDTLTERLQESPPSVKAARRARRFGKKKEQSWKSARGAMGTDPSMEMKQRFYFFFALILFSLCFPGEKSYLCDMCGFAGGTRHALTKHRRQHTGERPFKCKFCNFASTTQSHLSRHKRVHTGEKPYRCPWCDYRSNCAENIRKHILHTGKHEGVKMYNCPKCTFGTNSPMEFRNHLKENHADIENPDLAYLHAGKTCLQVTPAPLMNFVKSVVM